MKNNVESNAKDLHRELLKKASVFGVSALMLLGVGAGMQGASAQHTVHADGVPSAEALLAEDEKNGGETTLGKESNDEGIAKGKSMGLIYNSLGNVVGYKGVKQLEAEGLKEGYEVPSSHRRAKRHAVRRMKRTARKRRANKRNAARKALRADQKLINSRKGKQFMKLYRHSLRRHMRKSARRALIRQLNRRANRRYVNAYKALKKARLLK